MIPDRLRQILQTSCHRTRAGSAVRRSLLVGFVACGALVLLPGHSSGQWGGGGWGGGMGWGNWSSTAQQGAQMGLAAVVRSQGYANLQNSEAAKN